MVLLVSPNKRAKSKKDRAGGTLLGQCSGNVNFGTLFFNLALWTRRSNLDPKQEVKCLLKLFLLLFCFVTLMCFCSNVSKQMEEDQKGQNFFNIL